MSALHKWCLVINRFLRRMKPHLRDKGCIRQHREALLKPCFEVEMQSQTHTHTSTDLKKGSHVGTACTQTHTTEPTKVHIADFHKTTMTQQLNKCCCLSVLGAVNTTL